METEPLSEMPPLSPIMAASQKRAKKLAKQVGWKVEFKGTKAKLTDHGRVLLDWTAVNRIIQRLRHEIEARQREADFGM